MRLVQNSVWPEVLVRQGRDGGMEIGSGVRMLTSGHIGRLE